LCGIAGIIDKGLERCAREEIVGRMVCTLNHRGPDEHAVLSIGNATFGVARLSIIDRTGSHQPMSVEGAGQQAMIAYNGEVYNYNQLRERHEREHTRLRTRGDTEVILASHLHRGVSAVEDLDGMFAYAVWDDTRQEVFLARDRLGIKPLFYAEVGGAFAFASEPKALFCLPHLARRPEHAAALEYFLHGSAFASGYVTGERSFFEGVRALPAGHFLVLADGRARAHRYWSPLDELGETLPDADEAVQELASEIETSTRAMLMGEVPVGTALSGGLDSSLITAEATRATSGQMFSACITYRDDHSDPDAAHAAIVSANLNSERMGSHHLEYTHLRDESYLDGLDDMVRAFDEPHWEPRQLAMFENYRTLARAGRTVVLTGEGADELFFGYYRKFPGFRGAGLDSPADFAALWRRRLPLVRTLLAPAFEGGLVSDEMADGLIDGAVASYLEPYWSATGSRLRAVQCWYLHTFLHWLLMDNDRCGMAHGIEGRFPFLSRRLVSLALRLPPEWNTGDGRAQLEKALLRRAAEGRLPAEVWRDRAKSPLPIPLASHYHARIAERLSLEVETAPDEVWSILDRQTVLRMIRVFRARLRAAGVEGGDALTAYLPLHAEYGVRSSHLFAILSFIRWHSLNFEETRKELPC
jgi:asparagine synthase (glutamine-hydrolysing)